MRQPGCPPTPVTPGPAPGPVTAAATIPGTGTAEAGVGVTLYSSGALAGRTAADSTGAWGCASVALAEGVNTLAGNASDRVGASALSAPVVVTRDTGPPAAPAFLRATDLGAGTRRFDWVPSTSADVAVYTLYRAASAFTQTSQASRVLSGLVNVFATDAPPSEGSFFF